ncbi:AAA family ATPase [Desulforhabdus sp. TSK]|uniref:AAA family ATPase n=1 Tax=Desulforhabdus sp. TSK TaxID=2925014 RepID=UPI001FC8E1F1|nr:AAA family ATPase [Desulforhabdus sp. TSK]
MHDDSLKTAVVFTDGLDFMNHTEPAAVRQMAIRMNQWGGLFSTNENICIFIFPDVDLKDLSRLFDLAPQWKFLQSKMFVEDRPSRRLIHTGPPRADEVESLFHYWRLKKELATDWTKFTSTTMTVTRRICSEGETLKLLSGRLRECCDFGKDTLSMLASENSPKEPALQRLKNMRGLETVSKAVEKFVALQKEGTQEPGSTGAHAAFDNESSAVSRLLPIQKDGNRGLNLHLVLTGSPGTGKTTVARMVGEIFREEGLLELGHMVEVSRQDLVAGYVGQTALKTAEKINQAMGGILFIDEAYCLAEGGESDFGKEAVETIMKAMSDHLGEFSVIIAGYPDRIQKFIEMNDGLMRRFGKQNIIHIPDYDPPLLQHIFEQQVKANGRRLDGAFQQLLPDFFVNWHAARDPQTFGNAGDAINIFQEIDGRRAERVYGLNLEREARFTITLEDVPMSLRGYLKARKAATVDEVMERLSGLTGLREVKVWLHRLTRRIQEQQERIKRGINTEPPLPGHYLFVGRPGTGKTTVARLVGSIYQLLGLLGRSEPFEVSPGDLIDRHGGTNEKATRVFQKAINGVLFIDEAHQLAEDGNRLFGQVAVKELVPFMLNNEDRLCVIAAGYPEEMERFLDLDPGLRSRFTKIIHFEDFDATALLEVFQNIVKRNNETLAPSVEEDLERLFEIWTVDRGKDFGNARDVHRLVERMRECRSERLDLSNCSDAEMLMFLPQDIPDEDRKRIGTRMNRLEDILGSMDHLVGLSRVKETVRSLINRIKVEKARENEEKLAPGHYLFVGNPGTGKTTVARLMGSMFHALGLLKKGHLVEVGRSDLVGAYQGHTALKTKDILERSLDGVLFIDEAYQLVQDSHDSFGKEALETLVAFMENHRDRLCIVAAGYPEPMYRFIQENPGLPSRFPSQIVFDDYSAEEMLAIFRQMAADRNMILGDGLDDALLASFEGLVETAGRTFGNGREVRNLFDAICSRQADRLAGFAGDLGSADRKSLFTLEISDLPQGMRNSTAPKPAKCEPPFLPLSPSILAQSYPRSINGEVDDERPSHLLVEPSLLFLVVQAEDGEACGSGFIISHDGLALTCEHVVRGASSIRARVRWGGRESWHSCRVAKAVHGINLAMIQLEGENFPSAVLASPDRSLQKGEAIGLLAYPLGKQLSDDSCYTEGNVTSVQSDEYGDLVQCSVLAHPGSSGGPVFSRRDGTVLGLLLGAFNHKDAVGINFFRPVRYGWQEFFLPGPAKPVAVTEEHV